MEIDQQYYDFILETTRGWVGELTECSIDGGDYIQYKNSSNEFIFGYTKRTKGLWVNNQLWSPLVSCFSLDGDDILILLKKIAYDLLGLSDVNPW